MTIISGTNIKLRKYLKKTGDGISHDDEAILNILERAFDVEIHFQVICHSIAEMFTTTKIVTVKAQISSCGHHVKFSSDYDSFDITAECFADSIQECAHLLIEMIRHWGRLIFKTNTIEIPSFESAAELKMKLQLMGKSI